MSNYALINLNDESEEQVFEVAVAADDESAHSFWDESYDYVINIYGYSPVPQIGSLYDPGLDSFTDPPEDFVSEMESEFATVIDALNSLITIVNRTSSESEDPLTDYASAIGVNDTSALPSDFVSNVWPDIMDYLNNVIGYTP